MNKFSFLAREKIPQPTKGIWESTDKSLDA